MMNLAAHGSLNELCDVSPKSFYPKGSPMFQSFKDKLSNSKKIVAAAGVVAVGALTQVSAAPLLTTVSTTDATADIGTVLVALVGVGILVMGGRKVLSLLGH
jgi:hypothetical protein